jgi:hypothetical protein
MVHLPKVLRFVAHGRRVQRIASEHGWHPGARYTNLRDIREIKFENRGFLDIDWKRYNFERHLKAVRTSQPLLTVARDLVNISDLSSILREADQLQKYAKYVVLVPKDPAFRGRMSALLPHHYLLGYSVPTRYGGTLLHPTEFDRPVHLLGGRPDKQRALAEQLPVVSVDCNRFTLDAAFGDYFDGETFRPHPLGGYDRCLHDSIANINQLWADYATEAHLLHISGA